MTCMCTRWKTVEGQKVLSLGKIEVVFSFSAVHGHKCCVVLNWNCVHFFFFFFFFAKQAHLQTTKLNRYYLKNDMYISFTVQCVWPLYISDLTNRDDPGKKHLCGWARFFTEIMQGHFQNFFSKVCDLVNSHPLIPSGPHTYTHCWNYTSFHRLFEYNWVVFLHFWRNTLVLKNTCTTHITTESRNDARRLTQKYIYICLMRQPCQRTTSSYVYVSTVQTPERQERTTGGSRSIRRNKTERKNFELSGSEFWIKHAVQHRTNMNVISTELYIWITRDFDLSVFGLSETRLLCGLFVSPRWAGQGQFLVIIHFLIFSTKFFILLQKQVCQRRRNTSVPLRRIVRVPCWPKSEDTFRGSFFTFSGEKAYLGCGKVVFVLDRGQFVLGVVVCSWSDAVALRAGLPVRWSRALVCATGALLFLVFQLCATLGAYDNRYILTSLMIASEKKNFLQPVALVLRHHVSLLKHVCDVLYLQKWMFWFFFISFEHNSSFAIYDFLSTQSSEMQLWYRQAEQTPSCEGVSGKATECTACCTRVSFHCRCWVYVFKPHLFLKHQMRARTRTISTISTAKIATEKMKAQHRCWHTGLEFSFFSLSMKLEIETTHLWWAQRNRWCCIGPSPPLWLRCRLTDWQERWSRSEMRKTSPRCPLDSSQTRRYKRISLFIKKENSGTNQSKTCFLCDLFQHRRVKIVWQIWVLFSAEHRLDFRGKQKEEWQTFYPWFFQESFDPQNGCISCSWCPEETKCISLQWKTEQTPTSLVAPDHSPPPVLRIVQSDAHRSDRGHIWIGGWRTVPPVRERCRIRAIVRPGKLKWLFFQFETNPYAIAGMPGRQIYLSWPNPKNFCLTIFRSQTQGYLYLPGQLVSEVCHLWCWVDIGEIGTLTCAQGFWLLEWHQDRLQSVAIVWPRPVGCIWTVT